MNECFYWYCEREDSNVRWKKWIHEEWRKSVYQSKWIMIEDIRFVLEVVENCWLRASFSILSLSALSNQIRNSWASCWWNELNCANHTNTQIQKKQKMFEMKCAEFGDEEVNRNVLFYCFVFWVERWVFLERWLQYVVFQKQYVWSAHTERWEWILHCQQGCFCCWWCEMYFEKGVSMGSCSSLFVLCVFFLNNNEVVPHEKEHKNKVLGAPNWHNTCSHNLSVQNNVRSQGILFQVLFQDVKFQIPSQIFQSLKKFIFQWSGGVEENEESNVLWSHTQPHIPFCSKILLFAHHWNSLQMNSKNSQTTWSDASHFIVDLDQPPSERWKHILDVYKPLIRRAQ